MPKYYVKSVLATIIFTPSNLGTLLRSMKTVSLLEMEFLLILDIVN